MVETIKKGACPCKAAEELAELREDVILKDEEISLLERKVARSEAATKKLTVRSMRADQRIKDLESQLAGGKPQMECNQEKLQSL